MRREPIPTALLGNLQTFFLFSDAPKPFQAKLTSKFKIMQYHIQEYIIKEGDPALSMFWILKGAVGVTFTDGDPCTRSSALVCFLTK